MLQSVGKAPKKIKNQREGNTRGAYDVHAYTILEDYERALQVRNIPPQPGLPNVATGRSFITFLLIRAVFPVLTLIIPSRRRVTVRPARA